jgi:hypothetical protein
MVQSVGNTVAVAPLLPQNNAVEARKVLERRDRRADRLDPPRVPDPVMCAAS